MTNNLPKRIDIFIIILNTNHMINIGKFKYQIMKNIWQYQVVNLRKYKYFTLRIKK